MEVGNNKLCLCYGSMALFTTILHNIFLLYHIETFVSIYKIDKYSFWIGETIFLVWNSCNDPLFGWASDKYYLEGGQNRITDIVSKRFKALSWSGPLFAVTFLSFWIPWANPTVQFIVCLCAYDGFLTMVDLNHNALLADLSVSSDTRMKLNTYCAIFGIFGSVSVFLSYFVWNRSNFRSFQVFCTVLSGLSLLGFYSSSNMMVKAYKPSSNLRATSTGKTNTQSSIKDENRYEEKKAVKKFLKNLIGHKNFVAFAVMNLVQVFHCHFNSNFFPLFLDSLLGDSVSQTFCSVILGISFIAPHINNLYFLTLCRRYGTYYVIRGLFGLKLVLSAVMFVLGPKHIWLLAIFIASNRVFTEGTCKLLNLVISDLVDEDYVIHSRPHAVSALLFGTCAFVSKPGQTLAPLVGTWLLSVQTGHDVFATGNDVGGSIKLDMSEMDASTQDLYRNGVFNLLLYIPIFCALVQLAAWSRFTLYGHRLSWIKTLRKDVQSALI